MKKFSAILICLLMIVTCSLAGCASFSINKVKYYNEVLATVDETKITRFDLLTAYNSYGNSYYVQQMGQSESDALKSTLDLLIDRELMYQYALDQQDLYKPTAYQVNEIVKEIFDSVDEQMSSYVEQAKKILNIEIEEDDEEDDKSDNTAYKLEDYQYSPRAVVKSKQVNDETQYYIEYIVEKEDENFEKLISEQYLTNFTAKNIASEIKTKYFEHFKRDLDVDEGTNSNKIYNKVRSLFADSLIEYEFYLRDNKGNEYSKVTEDLFNRYFNRTFESQIKSQYLDNIRTHYLNKSENLSIDILVDEYQYLSSLSYNLYNNNHDAYKEKMKNISTDGDSVLYHPETDTQFGYFIHTLISFDGIKENLKLLEKEKDETRYQQQYNALVSSVTAKARNAETGLVDEDAEEISLSAIIDEYNQIQNYSTYDEKLSAFINFMFKYTSDTATLSAGMPYVVGTNGYSAMVEEFNNEAIDLMKGQPGNMSVASVSDIDNLCITEYGIHLLFFVGDVNSFDIPYADTSKVYIQDKDIQNEEMFNLVTKVINPLTNETYFDKMFDVVYPAESDSVYSSNNGYTDYEKGLIAESKVSNKVTKYKTKIDATKVSL